MTRPRIVIVGSSGHALVALDAVELDGGFQIAGLLDRNRNAGEHVGGYQILGSDDDYLSLSRRFNFDGALVAIGDNTKRRNVVRKLQEAGCGLFPTIIHPKANIARGVQVGPGSLILVGASVTNGAKIGSHCIVNTNASIDHGCALGDFVSVGPGAALGGDCFVGIGSMVGIGAAVKNGISIGQYSVIGAGATLVKSAESNSLYLGTPAEFINRLDL